MKTTVQYSSTRQGAIDKIIPHYPDAKVEYFGDAFSARIIPTDVLPRLEIKIDPFYDGNKLMCEVTALMRAEGGNVKINQPFIYSA